MAARPHRNDKDAGSNPASTRNEKGILGGPLRRRSHNGPTGSKWKTSDIKADLDL